MMVSTLYTAPEMGLVSAAASRSAASRAARAQPATPAPSSAKVAFAGTGADFLAVGAAHP